MRRSRESKASFGKGVVVGGHRKCGCILMPRLALKSAVQVEIAVMLGRRGNWMLFAGCAAQNAERAWKNSRLVRKSARVGFCQQEAEGTVAS
jgi:hypothetical protein